MNKRGGKKPHVSSDSLPQSEGSKGFAQAQNIQLDIV